MSNGRSLGGSSAQRDDGVLGWIQGMASSSRLEVATHAEARMRERRFGWRDVLHAIATATRAEPQANRRRWRLEGVDLSGTSLVVIVEAGYRAVLVTVF